MKKANLIILDRDGVINIDSIDFIKSPEEWIPIPGSLEAIAKLNQAGYIVVIATNQSGINRGLFTLDTLQAIHQKLIDALTVHGGHLDGIYFCPHRPEENCICRKPKPGLLINIAKDFNLPLEEATLIGDSWRDIAAGLAVKTNTILVRTGNGEKTLQEQSEQLNHTLVYNDLAAAAEYLCLAQNSSCQL